MITRMAKGSGTRRYTAADAVAFAVVFGLAALAASAMRQGGQPIAMVEHALPSLDPALLPLYALRTTLRMLGALVVSFVFTLVYATAAAKSRRAERVLIPVLDVLQSVPVLGYISFTVAFFLALFPGKVMGAELACVFAIFTGQAWNMTLSLYQALRTLPADLVEVAHGFHLSAWQRFTRLELPFAMPGLVWNMMMSMSGGWFFIVAAEAIKVGDLQISLPGIGSYLALAIQHRDLAAVGWTILAMAVVILLYDQLLFRPLVAWADKFRFDTAGAGPIVPTSWLLDMLKRARLLQTILAQGAKITGAGFRNRRRAHLNRLSFRAQRSAVEKSSVSVLTTAYKNADGRSLGLARDDKLRLRSRVFDLSWYGLVAFCAVEGLRSVYGLTAHELTTDQITGVLLMGFVTLCRVATVVIASTIVWVPLGVYVGLRPNIARIAQPVAQFLAAFPANLFFPIAVIVILHFSLDPDLWLTPLIMLGTQWYVLFNVIAGASAFPHDLRESARSFHVGGFLWWRRVILPGIMPYYLTGALAAMGNAWNTTIVAEAVDWGDAHVTAYGIGAYIAEMTDKGDYPHIVLGIAVMSLYVLLVNRILWQPLLRWSKRRFRLG